MSGGLAARLIGISRLQIQVVVASNSSHCQSLGLLTLTPSSINYSSLSKQVNISSHFKAPVLPPSPSNTVFTASIPSCSSNRYYFCFLIFNRCYCENVPAVTTVVCKPIAGKKIVYSVSLLGCFLRDDETDHGLCGAVERMILLFFLCPPPPASYSFSNTSSSNLVIETPWTIINQCRIACCSSNPNPLPLV